MYMYIHTSKTLYGFSGIILLLLHAEADGEWFSNTNGNTAGPSTRIEESAFDPTHISAIESVTIEHSSNMDSGKQRTHAAIMHSVINATFTQAISYAVCRCHI